MIKNNEVGGNAPALERANVEITPAMVEAGASVVMLDRHDLSAEELARQVFEAMVRAGADRWQFGGGTHPRQ